MKRLDCVTFIRVNGANPNGDPRFNNEPRVDFDGLGLISDVCIKKKIRNRLSDMGELVFVQDTIHNNDNATSIVDRATKLSGKKEITKKTDIAPIKEKLIENYIDVRLFGTTCPTENPISMTGAVTVQPANSTKVIRVESIGITKCINGLSSKNKDDSVNEDEQENTNSMSSDRMGEKHLVFNTIYKICFSVNARRAEQNSVSEEDIAKLKEAVRTLFVNDDSAARPAGSMEVLESYYVSHNTLDGKLSAQKVYDSITMDDNRVVTVKDIEDATVEKVLGF